jgi:hypothetical protein
MEIDADPIKSTEAFPTPISWALTQIMPEFNLTILTTHLMFTKNISVTENKPK